ncbi:MAG: patatin-like phospholipase family protein, partial [Candidatus Obscuribacterales bacterium]|nr:patatin-like phospholipase family protein [Candidatus Obscuribacterales bacterium]
MNVPHSDIGSIDENKEAEYYLTFSSGGSHSYLSSLGAIAGCWISGLRKFRMLGGVSAGSIASSLASLGIDAAKLLHMGLDLNFNEHLGVGKDLPQSLWNLFKRVPTRKLDNSSDLTQERHTG